MTTRTEYVAFVLTTGQMRHVKSIAQGEDVSVATVVRWAIQGWGERTGVAMVDGPVARAWAPVSSLAVRVPVPSAWKRALIRACDVGGKPDDARWTVFMRGIVATYIETERRWVAA